MVASGGEGKALGGTTPRGGGKVSRYERNGVFKRAGTQFRVRRMYLAGKLSAMKGDNFCKTQRTFLLIIEKF